MQILDYKQEYQQYFERLNKEWLEKYFYVEPIDEYVLTNPEEAIIDKGGKILFAEHEGNIIGTIALKWNGEGVIEITKMGVNENYQGLGAGKLLFDVAVKTAKQIGAKQILLYSNRKLETAIAIYRNYGFVEIPLEPGLYERSDIKMELPFS